MLHLDLDLRATEKALEVVPFGERVPESKGVGGVLSDPTAGKVLPGGLTLRRPEVLLPVACRCLARGKEGRPFSSRALLVGIPLVAVTVANEDVGVSAAVLYALAFTVELVVGLVTYFGAEPRT